MKEDQVHNKIPDFLLDNKDQHSKLTSESKWNSLQGEASESLKEKVFTLSPKPNFKTRLGVWEALNTTKVWSFEVSNFEVAHLKVLFKWKS